MTKLFLIPLVFLTGCSISKFNQPPAWASAVTTHSRFFGVKADIPMGGSTVMGIHLGFGSIVWTVLPVSTNAVFIPKFSDTYSVGQTINPFDTRIREYLQTGWDGEAVPPPANMFAPQTK